MSAIGRFLQVYRSVVSTQSGCTDFPKVVVRLVAKSLEGSAYIAIS